MSGTEGAQHSTPTAELTGIRMTGFRKGEREWVLSADRGWYRGDTDTIELSPIRMTTFGGGRSPLHMSAPLGVMTVSSRTVILPEGIEGRDEAGMLFSARRAIYSNRSSLVRGSGGVRYRDPMLHLSGESLQFTTDSRILTLDRGVEAVVQFRGEGS
ncbi:MAG: hypothetical protein Fur0034_17000 [Desulfuromonadia bacterium]